jgi:hypothetical protein
MPIVVAKDSLNNRRLFRAVPQKNITNMKNWLFSSIFREMPGFFLAFLVLRAYFSHQGQQSFAGQPQIRQCKQGHDLSGVLGQSAIAYPTAP